MDKFKNLKIITFYFKTCLNQDIIVDYSVADNGYRISLNNPIYGDGWDYLIFPYKDKFLKWGWETYNQSSHHYTESSFDNFNKCVENLLKYCFNQNIGYCVKANLMGFFEDNYQSEIPF